MLGWALFDSSIADVITQLRWPKRIGFILAGTCGFLLFVSKAEEYYYNAFFRTKMLLFVLVAIHALVFRRSVYGDPIKVVRLPSVPRRARLAASLSLLLWLGILCVGRGIGYVAGRPGMHFR
jgi:uncharacterized membrane protein